MSVAKRQRREKLAKMEQRKVWGPEWGPQVKQTALLASPIYIEQALGEERKHKKMSQNWTRGFSSHLLGQPALTPQGCIFLCLPNKTELYLNCNTGLPFQIFAAARQNWGNYTLSQHNRLSSTEYNQVNLFLIDSLQSSQFIFVNFFLHFYNLFFSTSFCTFISHPLPSLYFEISFLLCQQVLQSY